MRATFTIITAYCTSLHLEPQRPIKTAAPAAYWLLNSDPGPRLNVVLVSIGGQMCCEEYFHQSHQGSTVCKHGKHVHIHVIIFNVSYFFCYWGMKEVTLLRIHSWQYSLPWQCVRFILLKPLEHSTCPFAITAYAANRKRKYSFRKAKWSHITGPLWLKALYSSQRMKRSTASGEDHITYRCEHHGRRKKWGDPQLGLKRLQSVCIWKWIPINHIYKTALPSSRM